MAVKIRLKRMGKIRQPHYRIVVADSRTKRDGRVIEEIGKYHPKQEPSFIEVDSERVQYWLGVGAQPSEPVTAILKVTGDWQKFKGEPAPEPMKVAEPKRDKTEIFNEALKDSTGDTQTEAVTRKKSPAKKVAADQPAAETEEATKTAETTEATETAETPAAEAEATSAEETSEATASDSETKSSEAGTEEAPAAEGAQADEKPEA